MNINNLIESAKRNFPNFSIVNKKESLLMRFIGSILFFNPRFMTTYTTTLGSTIYVPNVENLEKKPISSAVILLHELVHVYDSIKINKYLFGALYLFPQILSVLFLPLLFVSWKLALIPLLFLTPLPAYFRMIFEKRAYMAQLYVTHKLNMSGQISLSLEDQKNSIMMQFDGSGYYWMWIFKRLEKDFDKAIIKIEKGERPFEDPVFDILDKIIADSL